MGTTPPDTSPVSGLDGGLGRDAASPSDTTRAEDAGLPANLIINAQDHVRIDNYLAGQIERLNLVGLAAAVVDEGEIRYFKAWGQADREQGINADPRQTLWRLASLSKGVTGVIATRLAQRQAIDLEAPLPNLEPEFSRPTRYLPSNCETISCTRALPDNASALTLDLLLHHRGGIVHYSNGLGNPSPPQTQANDPQFNTGMRWSISYLAGQPLIAQPGTLYSYTSFGYNLVGAALEALTETSFDELLRREVSEPAQAPSLQVERLWEPLPNLAAVYKRSGNTMRRDDRSDVSWKAAGGGLVATIEDLSRYCHALIERKLTGEARDTQLWSATPDNTYAHGFFRQPQSGIIEHNGAQQGARSGLLIQPDAKRCFLVMTNSEAGNGTTWVRAMAERW